MSLALAFAPQLSASVIVDTKLFGPLTVSESEIYFFPSGLFGLPECRSFIMLPAERDGFYWLQSVEHSALAFMLVDPFLFFEGYSVDLDFSERADLVVEDESDAAILAIVTLPRSSEEPLTANLQGPLAINLRAKRGRQIALQDNEYGVRCPLEISQTK
jgi:flagellar assembly factor FliW